MHIARVGGGASAAMAAGLRAQIKTDTLSQVLKSAGLLDPSLARSLEASRRTAEAVTRGGAELLAQETLGAMLDVLA